MVAEPVILPRKHWSNKCFGVAHLQDENKFACVQTQGPELQGACENTRRKSLLQIAPLGSRAEGTSPPGRHTAH